MKDRLAGLIDFGRLNAGEQRVCIAATDLESGDLVLFDTGRGDRLEMDHLLASCGYLPEFAPVELNGRLLGDGGLSANVPLEAVLTEEGEEELLAFVVDLYARDGPRPSRRNYRQVLGAYCLIR
jgi:NTE family protein